MESNNYSSPMSGVKQASKTSISIDFYYRGVRCRERVRLAPTKANIAYCEKWKSGIDREIIIGSFDYAQHFPKSSKLALFNLASANVPLVKDALDKQLKSAKKTLARSTWMDYKNSAINHLIPEFGELRLDEIKRSTVKDWASSLKVSQKRLNNMLLPLRGALNEAYADEIIDRNPLYGYTPKPSVSYEPSREKKVDPFTPDELHAICKEFKDATLVNQVIFSAWTGLRPSELIALKWEQVDLFGETIKVDRAFVLGQEKVTKTKAGNRTVDLLGPALEAIKKQKSITFLKGEHVFIDPRTSEGWASYKPFREYPWKRALKKAGVRYRTPHQLRHTFASMMISASENIKWIANQMGHTDIVMVAKVYSQWMPSLSSTKAGSAAVSKWDMK